MYLVREMQTDNVGFLEDTSTELERLQRQARSLGLFSIAYLLELTREEVFDELQRSLPRQDPTLDSTPPAGPNIVPMKRSRTAS